MTQNNKVTEEDLKATEVLLARSFTNMKSAVTRIPGDIVKPVSGTIKAHPYATLGAAAGIGLISYELLRVMTPRVVMRDVKVQPKVIIKEPARSSMSSQVLALAAPYIITYLQQEVGRLLTQPQKDKDPEINKNDVLTPTSER